MYVCKDIYILINDSWLMLTGALPISSALFVAHEVGFSLHGMTEGVLAGRSN